MKTADLTPYPRPDREGDDMSELKPCPFCGNAGLTLDNLGDDDSWSVDCGGCGAQFPSNHWRDGAIAAWNRRAEPGWQPISSAPRDGTEIVFINQFAHCSDVVHWRAPYTKSTITFPGRFENRSGQSTGANDDTAWSFWIASPLPSPPVEAASPAHAELSPGNSSDLRGEEG